MIVPSLYHAVQQLAQQTCSYSDADLGQPYRWRAHEEGVRFALIGTYHELRELAVQLGQARAEAGLPLSRAQRALAPYHAAFRDLQAVLLGVDEETWGEAPGPDEWSLRSVVAHIVHTERTFFTLVDYGVARQQEGEALSATLPDTAREALFGDESALYELFETGSRAELMGIYEEMHRRALEQFARIDEEQLQGPSRWWEGETYSLLYRLLRFDAHLRQHTVQAEKVLARLGQPPTEARRLLRLVYQALAAVESGLLGDEAREQAAVEALAEQIVARTEAVSARVAATSAVVAAVLAGERERVQVLLAEEPALANSRDEQGVPLVRVALYRNRPALAADFVAAGAELSIMEGAALGRQDVLEAAVAEWEGWVNEYSTDGFTPLQLACFFGHVDSARYLLAQGAELEAVSHNPQTIRPIHAAAAGPASETLIGLLLEHGADPNARQQQAFTALHTAGQQGDLASARLLLAHGADPRLADEAGRTPAELARAQGYEALAALLAEAAGGPEPAPDGAG